MVKIAVVLMVKNEAARIEYTIRSCSEPSITGFIIYDTGSTDDTINVIKRTAGSKHVDIIEGEFHDFATSRNILLDFAQKCANKHDYDLFFLLDANDELIFEDNFNPESLVEDTNVTAWLISCDWKVYPEDAPITFRNTKLVRSRISEMKWNGVVHEYLSTPGQRNICDSVRVFQDRIKDNDGKTAERWHRDKILLEKEVSNDSKNARNTFYLAQTYACLGENDKAYRTYAIRTSLSGFAEEKYCSLYKCGEIAIKINMPNEIALSWLTKAFLFSERAEPLILIAEIYEKNRNYKLAYAYANLACHIIYPKDALLFVDKNCYDYKRWHVLGRIAWYAAKNTDNVKKILEDGAFGCNMAIQSKNLDIDKNNMSFY